MNNNNINKVKLLIAYNGLSSLADSFFYLVLLSFVTEQTALKNLIPLVSLSETLPYFLAIFIGVVADRVSRKNSMLLFSNFVRVVLYLTIAGFSFGNRLFLFVLVACVLNIVSDIFGKIAGNLQLPVIKLLLPDEGIMAKMQGLNTAVGQLATVLGTVLGGFLYNKFEITPLLFMNIGIFTLLFLLTFIISGKLKNVFGVLENIRIDKRKMIFWKELKESFSFLHHQKGLKGKLFLVSMTNCLLGLTMMIISVARNGQKISGFLSAVQAIQLVAMIIGSILVGSLFQKVRLERLLQIFFLTYFIFLLCFWQNVEWGSLVFIAIFSLILGAITPKFITEIMQCAAIENIGGFVGTVNTIIMIIPLANTLLLGFLLDIFSVQSLFAFYSLLAIMLFFLVFVFVKKE